jgi:hypothetical protein
VTDVFEEFTASVIMVTDESLITLNVVAVSSSEASVNIYHIHGATFQKTAAFASDHINFNND